MKKDTEMQQSNKNKCLFTCYII